MPRIREIIVLPLCPEAKTAPKTHIVLTTLASICWSNKVEDSPLFERLCRVKLWYGAKAALIEIIAYVILRFTFMVSGLESIFWVASMAPKMMSIRHMY